jgi:hypothetical protein
MPRTPIAELEITDDGRSFVRLDGVRIAERKRAQNGAGKWETLVPGYVVSDVAGGIEVRHNGVRIN